MVMPGATGLTILDLGCGTGLTGVAFRDLAARARRHRSQPRDDRKGARRATSTTHLRSPISRRRSRETAPLRSDARGRHAGLSRRSGARVRRRATAVKAGWLLSLHGRSQDGRRFRAGSKAALAPFRDYICANWPLNPVSRSRVSWRARHVTKPMWPVEGFAVALSPRLLATNCASVRCPCEPKLRGIFTWLRSNIRGAMLAPVPLEPAAAHRRPGGRNQLRASVLAAGRVSSQGGDITRRGWPPCVLFASSLAFVIVLHRQAAVAVHSAPTPHARFGPGKFRPYPGFAGMYAVSCSHLCSCRIC